MEKQGHRIPEPPPHQEGQGPKLGAARAWARPAQVPSGPKRGRGPLACLPPWQSTSLLLWGAGGREKFGGALEACC